MTAQEIISKCVELQQEWTVRNTEFKKWYDMLVMVDKLKEPNMESFVSNEPRTFFNLALHLLTPTELAFRIPLEALPPDAVESAQAVEQFLSQQVWRTLERNSLLCGRGGFLRELVSHLLITGWYSVFAVVTSEEVVAEVWNPAEVFPEFTSEGLVRVAHIFGLSAAAANRKIAQKGWQVPRVAGATKLYDYWTIEDGVVCNAIVLGNELVKDLTEEPLRKLPVYCAPVAGLPDRGAIVPGQDWRKRIGQSLLATNEHIYGYVNKLMTFMMQLIRDTAQPRWIEKTSGEPRVKPEDIFRRGAVFHLGLNETLEPLASPAIPIELRALLFDIVAMRQKGSLPDALYGAVGERMSGYLMSQISGAAAHILRPYQQALQFLIEEMCNDWLEDIREYGLEPYGVRLPRRRLPRVEVDFRLEIPGDLVRRATVARMLSPDFSLSVDTVTDMLFPEIRNPLAERAKVIKDKAYTHPVMVQLNLAEALQDRAQALEAVGNLETAEMYRRAAAAILQAGAVGREEAPPEIPPGVRRLVEEGGE